MHMATGRIASLTRNGFVNGLAENRATSAGRLTKWHCGSVAVWRRECVACRWITHWHYQHRNRQKPTNGPEMTVLPLTNDHQRRHSKNNTKKSIHHATSFEYAYHTRESSLNVAVDVCLFCHSQQCCSCCCPCTFEAGKLIGCQQKAPKIISKRKFCVAKNRWL